MFWSTTCILSLGATLTHAFQDASPYMAFSTADLDWTSPRIATAKTVQDRLIKSLGECPTDYYILAQQPGVNSEDYTIETTPHLKEWLEGATRGISYGVAVSEMVGEVDSAMIQKTLKVKCNTKKLFMDPDGPYPEALFESPMTLVVNLPELEPGSKRAESLRANDQALSNLIAALPRQSFTVLYSTTPGSASAVSETLQYEMEEPSYLHMDLKRDLNAHVRADNETVVYVDGPLFERYQYFTPGLFMGLLAMTFIFAIAYVAIKALSSLEVSYAAFDRENGPSGSTQKKSQ